MNKPIKILLVEDIPFDAQLVMHEMSRSEFEISWKIIETEKEYIESLNEFRPDLILSDYSLPAFNGLKALKLKEENLPDTPFILVTGSNNEETAVLCMKAGAEDYILKDNLKRLRQAVKAALDKKEVLKLKKEAEEKLSTLSRAVDQNPVSIMITGIDSTIEYVNPRFTETTGYTIDEVKGKNPRFLESGQQPAEFYAHLWETVLSGKEWTGEIHSRKKNGDLYWENARISPMVNNLGQITHLVSIREDVTEKRRMLEDLIEAKNRAEATDKLKSAFMSNISHEVRTPLNGIIGFSEMLADEEITPDQKYSYNEIIKQCGSRLLNTINNYMDSSLIVSGNIEAHNRPFSLPVLLDSVKAEYAERFSGKPIKFSVQESGNTNEVLLNSDQELLRKIICHLLDNAFKFTLQGSVNLRFRFKPEVIEFCVSDTGIGIDRDKKDLIFDYFTQADTSQSRGYEGSGLGLSISRGLIKLLGGEINAQSTKNKGSSFYFTLPASAIVSGMVIEPEVVVQPESKSIPVILVAEDDEFNFKYLDIILRKAGFLVVHAADGSQAVTVCRTNPDINLILMDMKMPVMGGLEATAEIRTFLPELPIIAQTAYVSPIDESAALQAGCNEFISKPVNKEKLLTLIQKYLGL